MGDLSAEPSMEDILSSIKRIIAEEGDGSQPRQRRAPRAAPAAAPVQALDHDEILELSVPMPPAEPTAAPVRAPVEAPVAAAPAPRDPEPQPQPPIVETVATAPDEQAPREPILSQQTAAASRTSLDTLSRLLVKPAPESDGTLEGLVRELLRPMLREWLDSNLPDMVEGMVSREIAKITGQR